MTPKLFKTDASYGFCNSKGEIIVSPRFNDVKANEYFYAFEVGNYWGFLDETGECIKEAQYKKVSFYDKYAECVRGMYIEVFDSSMKDIITSSMKCVQIDKCRNGYIATFVYYDQSYKYKFYDKNFKDIDNKFHDAIYVINDEYIAINDDSTIVILDIEKLKVIGTLERSEIKQVSNIKCSNGNYPILNVSCNDEFTLVIIKNCELQVINTHKPANSFTERYPRDGYYFFEYDISMNTTILHINNRVYFLDDYDENIKLVNVFPDIVKVNKKHTEGAYMLVTEDYKKWHLVNIKEMTMHKTIYMKLNRRKMLRALEGLNLEYLYNKLKKY